MKAKKILVVEDDDELRSRLVRIVAREGYVVDESPTGRDAIKKIKASLYDVVLLDLIMPGMSGIDVLPEIRKESRRTKVIILTAYATIGAAIEAMKKGASEFIPKPFKVEELLVIITRVIEEARFEDHLSRADLDNILSTLSNPTRREIIRLLFTQSRMKFNEIIKGLGGGEHSKTVFHMRILRDTGLITQDDDKLYTLTDEGLRVLEALNSFQKTL